MKVLIAIPSKGRADKIMQHTLRWVPKQIERYAVFVEPQEYEAYAAAGVENIQVLEQNDQGIAYVKAAIKRYAEENGYDLVFKMDDDIKRFTPRGAKIPIEKNIENFDRMMRTCVLMFDHVPDLGAIGYPYRNELYEPMVWSGINCRLQTCYLIRTELINTDFTTFEDLAQLVTLRLANKFTLRYGMLAIECEPIGKNGGGLQLFDRKAQALADCEKLRKIHPAIKFKAVTGKAWEYEPDFTNDSLIGARHL